MKLLHIQLIIILTICLSLFACKNKKQEKSNKTEQSQALYPTTIPESIEQPGIKQSYHENRFQEWKAETYSPEYISPLDQDKEWIPYEELEKENDGYITDEAFVKRMLFDKEYVEHMNDFISIVCSMLVSPVFSQLGEDTPHPYQYYQYTDENNNTEYGVTEIPINQRRFAFNRSEIEDKQWSIYYDVIDFLSRNRLHIDIYKMYNTNKELILNKINKENYDKYYRPLINSFVYAYHDLQDNEDFTQMLYAYLYNKGKFADSIDRNSMWEGEIINKHFEEKDKDTLVDDLNIPLFQNINNYTVYTFWMRRYNEGNAFSIYYTLNKIKADYENLPEYTMDKELDENIE